MTAQPPPPDSPQHPLHAVTPSEAVGRTAIHPLVSLLVSVPLGVVVAWLVGKAVLSTGCGSECNEVAYEGLGTAMLVPIAWFVSYQVVGITIIAATQRHGRAALPIVVHLLLPMLAVAALIAWLVLR